MDSLKVEVVFSDNADEQYAGLQKRFRDKVDEMLIEICNTPTQGTGKVERMRGHGGHRYSRRVNKKDRLVYDYFSEENLVVVISCIGHYDAH
jgi:toxin YoeB